MASSWKRDALLLLFGIGLFFALFLGARPYTVPSEARYIEIPRQMLATDDWLTPKLNGVPYFEKPPLFYWLQATALKFFGFSEFTGRITAVLITALTCVLSYAVGRLLYGRTAGWFAALALATSFLGYGLSRIALLDTPVTLFITATLAAFLAAQVTQKRHWYYAMYAASALAVMTKGLIGIVIPVLVIGTWIVLTRRWQIIKEAKLFSGLALFLLIAAPWHIAMANLHPDFLQFYFIHEHFTRYLTDDHKRVEPWWFFIAVTLLGLIPWTGLLPKACKGPWRSDPPLLFLTLWILLPLAFFSASHSKLASYIFPIFPPLCILIGRLLANYWNGQAPLKALRANSWLIVAFGISILAGFPLILALPQAAQDYIVPHLPSIALLLVPSFLILAALIYALMAHRDARTLILLLFSFAIVMELSANGIANQLDNATAKPLIELIKPALKPGDMVVAYESYWQDVPVYLNRDVTVAGYAGELSFGVEHYPQTHEWMISEAQFWQRCASERHSVYVFVKKETARMENHPGCALHPLGEFGKTLLLKKD